MTRERFPADWDPKDEGYLIGIPMPDGRWWCLMRLSLDRLRIVIAEDYATAGEHWCYSDKTKALNSFMRFPEPPTGWTRHMRPDGTFERRDKHGQPYTSDYGR